MTTVDTPAHLPAPSRLESLPLDLLIIICEWLVQHEPRTKRSLCAFALASKTCRDATDFQRLYQMNLYIRGPRKLLRDVQSWRQTVQARGRTRLLRVVKITGMTISPEEEELEDQSGPGLHESRLLMPRVSWPSKLDIDVEEESVILLSGMDNPLSARTAPKIPSTQWPDEKPWQALADLFKDLPWLADVVFMSEDQFPRCLLSELHRSHPQSRLHMHYFLLRSLIHSEFDQPAVHPDDVALATSPCLYSIVAFTAQYRDHQVVDYNKEAIMDMVSGLAPRLTNVCTLGAFTRTREPFASTSVRPPWQGFPPCPSESDRKQPSRGHLQHLIIDPDGDRPLQWARLTDFSQLRSLTLKFGVEPSTVQQLTQIARQSPMLALSSFEINMNPASIAFRSEMTRLDAELAQLFETLHPLEELRVYGPVRKQSFDAIITHQTEKLRVLKFEGKDDRGVGLFVLSPLQAGRLARRCIQLEELQLQVARTQGDQNETAVYRHLGRLPSLKRLTLYLVLCVKDIPRSGSDAHAYATAEEVDVANVDLGSGEDIPLQEVFRDAAIDSNLALSIFGRLSRGSDLRILQLKLGGYYQWSKTGKWLRWLGRGWRVWKDSTANITANELRVEQRRACLRQLQKKTSEEWRVCKEAWVAVWSPRSEQWWDEWSSVPLQQGFEA